MPVCAAEIFRIGTAAVIQLVAVEVIKFIALADLVVAEPPLHITAI